MALGDRPHGCEVYGLREVLAWRVSYDFERPSTRMWSLWLEVGFGVAGLI